MLEAERKRLLAENQQLQQQLRRAELREELAQILDGDNAGKKRSLRLEWRVAGTVWAMDHSQPCNPISGIHKLRRCAARLDRHAANLTAPREAIDAIAHCFAIIRHRTCSEEPAPF